MQNDQLIILTILAGTVGMFLWGRWRQDRVAAGALMACVLTGLVAPAQAFAGFGHLAIITVACVLVLMFLFTMFLSDLVNNAVTVAVMCPIVIGLAAALGVSADAFPIAVVIGAFCAFLTPIGHQNNTLTLGSGGFRFSDCWRLGLVVEVSVVAISVPLLLWAWPL